jgi:hypothetical protein
VTDVEHWLHERKVMLPIFKQHLERAQARMTRQADKKRVERQFMVGDMVYLRLQPYVQTSVAQRSSQKLGFKYFGPFKVLKRIGAVAYKLQLPPDARIHPVVHVSQPKQAIKSSDPVSHVLPSYLIEYRDSVMPCRVVAERFIKRGRKMVPQVKLQWQGFPASCHIARTSPCLDGSRRIYRLTIVMNCCEQLSLLPPPMNTYVHLDSIPSA